MDANGQDSIACFKAAATDKFGANVEQKVAAEQILDHSLISSSESNEKDQYYSVAIENLERNARVSHWYWRCFYIFTVTVGLLIVCYHGWQVNKARQLMLGMSFGLPVSGGDPYGGAFDDLSEHDRLLLFGDKTQSSESLRWKALWDSEPENPAYYTEYLLAYEFEYSTFPPDMISVGEELAPGNAWFRAIQAGVFAENAVKRKVVKRGTSRGRKRSSSVRGRKKKKEGPPQDEVLAKAAEPLKEWEIKNSGDYEKALALFFEAAEMDYFDSGVQTMLNERVPLLPQGGDWLTRIIPIAYLAQTTSISIKLNYVSRVVQTEAMRCQKEKDKKALQRLISSWEKFGRHMANDSVTLVDALVARAWVMGTLPYFREAAKACDMPEEEIYFAKLYIRMLRDKEERNDRDDVSDESDDIYRKGGLLAAMIVPVIEKQVNDTSTIEPADYKPGRMTDHAFLGRLTSAFGWKFFLLMAVGVFLDRFRKGIVYRKLILNLRGALCWRDWMAVFVFGIIAPLVLFWLVYGMSPWSARHYSVFYVGFSPAFGQFGCLWYLLLASPALVLEWRLSRVIPSLGKKMRSQLWVSIVCAVIAMPFFGVAWENESGNMKLGDVEGNIVAYCLAAVALCLGLAHVSLNLKKKNNSLARSVAAYSLTPVYVMVSLAMAFAIPLYHAQEKYWVSQDDLLKITPENASFTKTESQVTRQVIVELKQAMGWKD